MNNNKEDCKIELNSDKSFKVIGHSEDSVVLKYNKMMDLLAIKNNRLNKTRWWIFGVLLTISTLIFFFERHIFIVTLFDFPTNDYLFTLASGFFGLAFRARFIGRDSLDKKVCDLIKGYIKYTIIVSLISLLILSILKHYGFQSWELYTALFSISFISGLLAFGALDKFVNFR